MHASRITVFAVLTCVASAVAFGSAEEHLGAEPLSAANYREWPGIEPLVNDPRRVYHLWVNGNEFFCYSGDAGALNDFLARFASVGSGPREVILRPAPAVAKSLDGNEVPYDWKLRLVGGIATHMATLHEEEKIWSKQPVVEVHVGDSIKIEDLDVPAGVRVVGLMELKARYRDALDSKDQTVRGWGAGELAALDPYDEENAAVIAKMLEDPEPWVRLNAAGALASFGANAKATVPALRAAREGANEELLDRIDQSVRAIESAKVDSAAVEKRYRTLAAIERFAASRKKE